MLARELSVLSAFRIEDLENNMFVAGAKNERRRVVYFFDARDPESNFNVIYDDMPLEGWWPWPKKCS